jgi:beta-glucosidase
MRDGTDPDARVERLLDALSPAERIAQLSCMGRAYELPEVFGADLDEAAFLRLVPDGTGQVGRVALRRGPDSARRIAAGIQRTLRDGTRAGIGALLNEEGVHGLMAPGATVLPSALALAATWDEDLVERVYAAVAHEARWRGSNYVYAPVLDLSWSASPRPASPWSPSCSGAGRWTSDPSPRSRAPSCGAASRARPAGPPSLGS